MPQRIVVPGAPAIGSLTPGGLIVPGGLPSWVPAGAKSYYEFSTDRGYSGGAVQPSSTSDLTMSRASSGYDLAATTLFNANAFRRTALGLLIEPAATNLAARSLSIGTSPWTTFTTGGATISVTGNSDVAPDGNTTATLISLNRGDTSFYAQSYEVFTSAAATYVVSSFRKAKTAGDVGKTVRLGMYDGATHSTDVALASAWTRASYSSAMSASGSAQVNSGFLGTGTQTGSLSYDEWGFQVELGTTPTSVIPTTTGSATRAADAASLTIPAGATTILYTFSDGSTQSVSVSPGAYTIPTNLNKPIIASMAIN